MHFVGFRLWHPGPVVGFASGIHFFAATSNTGDQGRTYYILGDREVEWLRRLNPRNLPTESWEARVLDDPAKSLEARGVALVEDRSVWRAMLADGKVVVGRDEVLRSLPGVDWDLVGPGAYVDVCRVRLAPGAHVDHVRTHHKYYSALSVGGQALGRGAHEALRAALRPAPDHLLAVISNPLSSRPRDFVEPL